MPVVQHPPGIQYQGEALVGKLGGGRCLLEADELGSRPPREGIGVEVRRAGVIRRGAGPLDAALPIQALVGDAAQNRHDPRHLRHDLGWVRVAELPFQAHAQTMRHATRHVADDFPIGAALTDGLDGLADALYSALAIGKRAILFRKAGGRQHHVGDFSRFMQKQVLDHEKVELLQRRLGMVQVRLREQRILPGNIHGPDAALVGLLHHLRDNQPRLRGHRRAPDCLKGFHYLRRELLVPRQAIGNAAGIAAALDVVLPTQRGHARARLPELSSGQCEVQQGMTGMRPVDMLRHTHAPDKTRSAKGRACVEPRGLPNILHRATGQASRLFDGGAHDDLSPLLEALGTLRNEGSVGEALLQENPRHGVEQSDVGAGIGSEPDVGVVTHLDALGVDDDELGPSLNHGPTHACRCHRVVGVGVGSGDDETPGLFVIRIGVAGRAAAQGHEHGLYRWRVTQTGAVIDIVGLHDQPGELLLDVAVLVRGLRGAQGSEGAAMLRQLFRHQVQRLIPTRLAKASVLLDQWRPQAVRVLHEVRTEAPLHAEHADAGTIVRVVLYLNDIALVGDLKPYAAPDAAVWAGGGHVFRDGGKGLLGSNGSCGTDGETGAAGRADGLGQGLVLKRADAARQASAQQVDGADELVAVLTALGAPPAQDAGIHGDGEEGTALVRRFPFPGRVGAVIDAVSAASGGELAEIGCRVASLGEHAQRQFQYTLADAPDRIGFGSHNHALVGGQGARGGEASPAIHFHEARATRPQSGHVRVLAEMRQGRSGQQHRIENRRSRRRFDAVAVYGYGGHRALRFKRSPDKPARGRPGRRAENAGKSRSAGRPSCR